MRSTFSVVDHARSSDTGKVRATDSAAAGAASATSERSTNAMIFMREPPESAIGSRPEDSAREPVHRRRAGRGLGPVAHDDDRRARAGPAPERVEDDGALGVVHVAGGRVGGEQRRAGWPRAAQRDAALLGP